MLIKPTDADGGFEPEDAEATDGITNAELSEHG